MGPRTSFLKEDRESRDKRSKVKECAIYGGGIDIRRPAERRFTLSLSRAPISLSLALARTGGRVRRTLSRTRYYSRTLRTLYIHTTPFGLLI